MSQYTLTEITLALIPNAHGGTGTHFSTNWVVDPGSVPGSGLLAFNGLDVEVTTRLFMIADRVVPNWFGVAVPFGISDFTRAHIFFHPTPGQAGYNDGDYFSDSDYSTKLGLWPTLFYYMERLGYQLDGARRNQVLIMPFLTEAMKDTGILPANWQDIVTQILAAVRATYDPGDNSPLVISQLAVSSFSAGIIYSGNFRRTAVGLSGVLAEVWDFDGRFSSYRAISEALHSTATVQAIKYDQVPSADPSSFHVPQPRWANYAVPPANGGQVHGLIRDFMFLHASTISDVGVVLGGPPAGTVGTHTGGTATATHTTVPGTVTHTATGSVSATHTGTASHSATATAALPTTAAAGTHSATASLSAAHSGTATQTSEGGTHTMTASLTVTLGGTATHTGAGTATFTTTDTGTATTTAPQVSPVMPRAPTVGPAIPLAPRTPLAPTPIPPAAPVAPLAPGGGYPPQPIPSAAPGAPSVAKSGCYRIPIPAMVAATASTAQAAQSALVAITHLRKRRR
jgi:hypothetical protein